MLKNVVFNLALIALLLGIALSSMGCGSLNNLISPMHAVDADGNKAQATLNSLTKQYTIGDIAYPYKDRPAVPAAPKEPLKPVKPRPPEWPREVKVITNNEKTVVTLLSREDALNRLDYYRSIVNGQRKNNTGNSIFHLNEIAIGIEQTLDSVAYEQNIYNSSLDIYENNVKKYSEWEKENAAYQQNLPKY